MLTLPFSTCSFVADAMDNETTSIISTIIVQQHRMMRTTYDIIQNVTCELSLPLDTFRQWYYPNTTLTDGHPNSSLPSVSEVSTWIETMVGSDLFPGDDSEVGTELFFVVNVRDGGKNQDMAVHNCIAHDDKVLTNETRLYQMSDVFGCPNTSYVLSNFTVSNQTEGRADLMAYTQMRNLVYTVKGEFFVTCGVVLCDKSCRNMCGDDEIPTMHYLSDIVVKRFVGRLPNATLPPSLDLFETRQRISKRSLSDTLTRWFTFGTSDLEVKEATFQEEDNSTESTQILLKEELDNTTDALYIANISKDLTFNVSENPLVRSAILLFNETRLSGFGHNYKKLKNSVVPEFTVCILFLLLVSCYGGLLYSNSKRNLKNTADRNNFMTELYSIVH